MNILAGTYNMDYFLVVIVGDICPELHENFIYNIRAMNYFRRKLFGDIGMFHVSGKINRHNLHISGHQNPHEIVEYDEIHRKESFGEISYTKIGHTTHYRFLGKHRDTNNLSCSATELAVSTTS